MFVKTYNAALVGVNAQCVTVEVSVEDGSSFSIVGLPDAAVRESYERIMTATTASGYNVYGRRTVINLSPGDLRKEGTAYDLSMAVALIASTKQMKADHLEEYILLGELSLDGKLRPVKGILPIALMAKKHQIKGMVVPKGNGKEGAVVKGVEVYEAETLKEVVEFLDDKTPLQRVVIDTQKEFEQAKLSATYDFADVKGQENVKRAMEVAAAGEAGYSAVALARATVMVLSSKGWRRSSSTLRLNSAISSKKRTPLCAKLISPGLGEVPPPTRAGIEIE